MRSPAQFVGFPARCLVVPARCLVVLGLVLLAGGLSAEPLNVSGVYPHLAMFNPHGECGTGAVVPWAGRLWVITYAPHEPDGSHDKLYEIDEDLNLTTRPESVGGTPAGRMIHRESGQLFIGPYAIDQDRRVRVITPQAMPGRLTGLARHLTEPERKLYYATMEEGFYEVDVRTLEVTTGSTRDANNGANSLRQRLRQPVAGLPRQGAVLRPGPADLRQQRRALRRGPAATRHALGRAGRVGRPGLERDPPQPVHGGLRAGRASRATPNADTDPVWSHRLGPPLAAADAARRGRVAHHLPPAQGEPTRTTAPTAGTPSGPASATSARRTC